MNNQYKILVTPKEACDVLRNSKNLDICSECQFIFSDGRIENQKELNRELKKVDAVILDLEKINFETLDGVHHLKVISRFGVGHDNIDKEVLKNIGIPLTITYGVASDAVARHALALILTSMHNILFHTQNARENIWDRKKNISFNKSKIGLIGHGQISQTLAWHLKNLGVDYTVYSRSQKTTLSAIINECQILSVHLPKNNQTSNLFNKAIFQKMNQHIIINTSRGGIVNEEDLLIALDNKQVYSYATDVFQNEPYSGISSELCKHPQVICTPHLASFDQKTTIDMSFKALENTLCLLKGKNLSSNYKILT